MQTIAIIDADPTIYAAACVGEERFINVKHLPSGNVKEFKNKTEFYGRKKDKSGGWLGEINAERELSGRRAFPLEDFEIEECNRVVEDISNVLHSAKMMLQSASNSVGADSYTCYIGGKQELFRWKQSNMLEYKGTRKNMLSPLLKGDVTNYILKHHSGILCNDDKEADDYCIIRAVEEAGKGNRAIVITSDKDVLGSPVLSFNPNKPDLGIQNGDQFGNLYLDDKGDVRGIGRIFKYWQWAFGDPTDNYRANACSDIKWGEKSAYNALKDCQNDRDAWKAVYDIYKMLYPEPIEIMTWRGNRMVIDNLYCMQEIFTNAHMLRHPKDFVCVADVLMDMGII